MIKNYIINKKPLIHCITNYVTVNDVANILLSSNASPVMSDSILEVEDITKISNALYLNIGTINERTIESMIKSLKIANKTKIPVILDPVGIGASKFRKKCVDRIINNGEISIIRGNISEIKAIISSQNSTRGVDASDDDLINENNLDSIINLAQNLSRNINCVIAISGKTDIICYKNECILIHNGNSMMSKITGTGCMLTSLIAAHAASNNNYFSACISAIAQMTIAGEIAFERMNKFDGNSSYRNYLIDAINQLDEKKIKERVNYEIRQ